VPRCCGMRAWAWGGCGISARIREISRSGEARCSAARLRDARVGRLRDFCSDPRDCKERVGVRREDGRSGEAGGGRRRGWKERGGCGAVWLGRLWAYAVCGRGRTCAIPWLDAYTAYIISSRDMVQVTGFDLCLFQKVRQRCL
jgi:hypothetical protein